MGSIKKYCSDQEDWGNSFDDMDSGNWENYLGGPEDSFFESQESDAVEKIAEFDCDLEDLPRQIKEFSALMEGNFYFTEGPVETTSQKEDEERMANNINHQLHIIEWLETSTLITKIPRLNGFYITKMAARIRLANGSMIELMDWLSREGMTNKKVIKNYQVIFLQGPIEGQELIMFIKLNEIPMAFKVIDEPQFPKELESLPDDYDYCFPDDSDEPGPDDIPM